MEKMCGWPEMLMQQVLSGVMMHHWNRLEKTKNEEKKSKKITRYLYIYLFVCLFPTTMIQAE